MQKSFLTLFTVLLVGTATIFTSCKKDKEASTQEKLVGKWTLDAAYLNFHFLGVNQKDTLAGDGTDYIQINRDGTVSGSGDSQVGVGTWKLVDNKLIIKENGEQNPEIDYDIKKLTSSELQLYSKQVEGEDFVEITMFLKK